jgi:hypothetical protein
MDNSQDNMVGENMERLGELVGGPYCIKNIWNEGCGP